MGSWRIGSCFQNGSLRVKLERNTKRGEGGGNKKFLVLRHIRIPDFVWRGEGGGQTQWRPVRQILSPTRVHLIAGKARFTLFVASNNTASGRSFTTLKIPRGRRIHFGFSVFNMLMTSLLQLKIHLLETLWQSVNQYNWYSEVKHNVYGNSKPQISTLI